MRKIGSDITHLVASLAGDSERARLNIRTHQVRNRYKRALERVYPETVQLFLEHTNNVYIFDRGGVKTLIVYVDESIYAAELNAQRELIKLHLLEMFGEDIEEFEISVSRGKYRKYHPYLSEERDLTAQKPPIIPLDDQEKSFVETTASVIQDNKLRKSLEKAMTADLEWKKGEKRTQSQKNGETPQE